MPRIRREQRWHQLGEVEALVEPVLELGQVAWRVVPDLEAAECGVHSHLEIAQQRVDGLEARVLDVGLDGAAVVHDGLVAVRRWPRRSPPARRRSDRTRRTNSCRRRHVQRRPRPTPRGAQLELRASLPGAHFIQAALRFALSLGVRPTKLLSKNVSRVDGGYPSPWERDHR